MGKAEIQEKINRLEREIRELKTDKDLYHNMNNKIKDAVTKLTNAKDSANKSYTMLKQCYQSDTASKKVTELENEYTNINNIKKELTYDILTASNNKLNSINSSINNKENQINALKKQMNSIEDT